MNKLGCKAATNIAQLSAAHATNYLINELFKPIPNLMHIVIHNGVNIFTEYLKLMEDDHFSLEFNYCDIYRIMINNLTSIVMMIFLL